MSLRMEALVADAEAAEDTSSAIAVTQIYKESTVA